MATGSSYIEYIVGPRGPAGLDADPIDYNVVKVMVQEALLQNPEFIGPSGPIGHTGYTG